MFLSLEGALLGSAYHLCSKWAGFVAVNQMYFLYLPYREVAFVTASTPLAPNPTAVDNTNE